MHSVFYELVLVVKLIRFIEIFMGVLIELYAGVFTLWLSPVQVNVIPVNNEYHLKYAEELLNEIKNNDIRVKLYDREEKLSYKMRESQTKKVPLTLIIGDNEKNNNLVIGYMVVKKLYLVQEKNLFLE